MTIIEAINYGDVIVYKDLDLNMFATCTLHSLDLDPTKYPRTSTIRFYRTLGNEVTQIDEIEIQGKFKNIDDVNEQIVKWIEGQYTSLQK